VSVLDGDGARAFHLWPARFILAAMNDAELLSISAAEMTTASPLANALLALNNDHAQELSWLTRERLTHLVGEAFLARRIGHVDAFLLAFEQDADYDSPNFLWFRAKYRRFVYVDRIVVAAGARGRGLARLLYRALFAEAARAGHSCVVCEINSEPPNPASHAFHEGLGFAGLGSAAIHNGSKTVRYLLRRLDHQAAVAGGSASTE
jgi:predicted GNAT superfamily acetyltransferase